MSGTETSSMSEMSSKKRSPSYYETVFTTRNVPGFNTMGWVYSSQNGGSSVQNVQITSIPEQRITPATHLQVLRNPRSTEQHFGSLLSPGLCNISDTYVRLLERQYEAGFKLANDPYSRWMAKNKTNEQIMIDLKWAIRLQNQSSPWIHSKAKKIQAEQARDKMLSELEHYRSFHGGMSPPAPVFVEANPCEAVRLHLILDDFDKFSRTSSEFCRAGKQRRIDMDRSRKICPEAREAVEEHFEEQDRLAELAAAEKLERKRQRRVAKFDERMRQAEERVRQLNALNEALEKLETERQEHLDSVIERHGNLTTLMKFQEIYGRKDLSRCFTDKQLMDFFPAPRHSTNDIISTVVDVPQSCKDLTDNNVTTTPAKVIIEERVPANSVDNVATVVLLNTDSTHTPMFDFLTTTILNPEAFICVPAFQQVYQQESTIIFGSNVATMTSPRQIPQRPSLTLVTIQEDFVEEEEEEENTNSILPFIYTNPFNLKSILKKPGSISRKRTTSFNEHVEHFQIEARESNDGPIRYSGADAAAAMMASADDEDDEDSDEEFDDADWSPGNTSGVSTAASSVENEDSAVTKSDLMETPTNTTLPEGATRYSGADAATAMMASGNDDDEEDDDEDNVAWDIQSGPDPTSSVSNSAQTATLEQTTEKTLRQQEDSSTQEETQPTRSDLADTSPYLHAASTPEEWKSLTVLLRLDVYAEAALELLKTGFPTPLRQPGTLRRCTWLSFPLPLGSPIRSLSRHQNQYDSERDEEREVQMENGNRLQVPRIVLTTPGGMNWKLRERFEAPEIRKGVEGWAAYLRKRKDAQEVMEERLGRWRVRDGAVPIVDVNVEEEGRGRAREKEEESRRRERDSGVDIVSDRGRERERGDVERCRQRRREQCVDVARDRERRGGDSGYGSEIEEEVVVVDLYPAL